MDTGGVDKRNPCFYNYVVIFCVEMRRRTGEAMLDKLERKFGKYAIVHLIDYLIGGYIIGYVLRFGAAFTNVNVLSYATLEPYAVLHQFQIWRVITWVLVPPQDNIIFAIIMIIFYWQLGRALEQTWGAFRFNVYIFGGILFTVIGAFLYYGITALVTGQQVVGLGAYFSTYYINMSIFLAFAVCYPDMQVMLYFLIPVRMKWMSIFYIIIIAVEFFQTGAAGKVAIAASLLNFLIFWLGTRRSSISPGQIRRKRNFRKSFQSGRDAFGGGYAGARQAAGAGRSKQQHVHKCAICGRTEITNPELEFRYCSKCNGNYEYCSDHLFTHTHVK